MHSRLSCHWASRCHNAALAAQNGSVARRLSTSFVQIGKRATLVASAAAVTAAPSTFQQHTSVPFLTSSSLATAVRTCAAIATTAASPSKPCSSTKVNENEEGAKSAQGDGRVEDADRVNSSNNYVTNSRSDADGVGEAADGVTGGGDGGEAGEQLSLPHVRQDQAAVAILKSIVPGNSIEAIHEMLKTARNADEVRRVLERVVYQHHLCFDLLNGHGFRVSVLQALSTAAPRTGCMREWFDCVDRFRRLGFLLTRTFAAEGFTTIRQWLSREFQMKGRVPSILTDGTASIKELVQWCLEDRLVFDHVLFTRITFLLTMIVSFFDRQNLYRVSFPDDFAKRDGIVVEWVITNERCVDYDECVLQCDALMEELLEQMRQQIPSRPPFSFMYRLADYYFATDNVDKLIAVMEDAESYGINVAESTTAKLMQLACAFNYPQVPELLLRWRVLLPQCVLATPDISRLLFYFSRSGGGLPCPHCGEPYNHRNVSVYNWLQTPPHQRQCPALQRARLQKGELEESRELPQNADWSTPAFQLYALSRERAIQWTATEWRGFLLCCMFSSRALEAKQLLDEQLPVRSMDDFLRATYMRLLQHHAPQQAWPTLQDWQAQQCNMSPIALQEALMAAAMVDDGRLRVAHIQHVWDLLQEKDSYVMPLTRRFYERRRAELIRQYASLATASAVDPSMQAEETRLMSAVINMQPRHVSLLDMKDSAADFVVGMRRKNVYHPPSG